jgi:hypothetical protein
LKSKKKRIAPSSVRITKKSRQESVGPRRSDRLKAKLKPDLLGEKKGRTRWKLCENTEWAIGDVCNACGMRHGCPTCLGHGYLSLAHSSTQSLFCPFSCHEAAARQAAAYGSLVDNTGHPYRRNPLEIPLYQYTEVKYLSTFPLNKTYQTTTGNV